MIDEKKIEEAAEEYAQSEFYYFNPQVSKICFKAGINWFLDNLWHDASEKPKAKEFDTAIITEDDMHKYNLIRVTTGLTDKTWKGWIHNFKTARWLYIDDFLKGGE